MSARRSPLALLVVLLALAGCGGSSSTISADPGPASVAPPTAAAYAEALVRPSNDVERGVLAAARKVLQVADPAGELTRLIDDQLDDVGSSFGRDFEPWLGTRVGMFVLRPPRHGTADVAVVAAVRDHDALEATIARQRANGTLRKGGSYRGVPYDLDRDDNVPNALVGDWYVAGNMNAFRDAVDTFKDGDSLADGARFEDAVEPLGDERLAFLYADPAQLLANVDAPVEPDEHTFTVEVPGLQRLLKSLRDADPVTLALTARADEIALELRADAAGTPLAQQQDGGLTVGELPGDAWLALATPALGPIVREVLDATGAHDEAAQALGAFGLDLDRDLLEPLGGLAAFARGTTPLDIGGGVLLKLGDATAASRLMTELQAIANAASGGAVHSLGDGFEAQIPRSPQPIVVQQQDDRIAAGYAASSARDLLEPQQRFDESTAGKAALESLGEGFTPSLVVIVPPIAELLESLDAIEVADFSQVLPYLQAYR
ncbi:MAG: DUF3352 domain-containing protein, partial [Conexibacter sp.]